ncbi:hypothetical protein [Salinibaculum rarum]|uniref:hypothetical protein n=1 Tax=Salinibaculum rarum TaxID=3058903 RepID=UPI00265FD2D3|nr:hypothetical protein [Salinibaculum sp. KK48]
MTTLPTTTIEHDGAEFSISYERCFICGDCGETWESRSAGDDDSLDKQNRTCPSCGATTGHTYKKRVSYYTKYDTIPVKDPPLDIQTHADAVRNFAQKLEALEANNWEMTQSDGVHFYLEKTITESTDSPHKVNDDLE